MTLVSYEIAKKAKEKGFDIPCSHFISEKTGQHYMNAYNDFHGGPSDYSFLKNVSPDYILVPTLEELAKWLREKHNLHIMIEPYKYNRVRWRSFIYLLGFDTEHFVTNNQATSEMAYEAGLNEALDMLEDVKYGKIH